jgi:hypothetical protein
VSLSYRPGLMYDVAEDRQRFGDIVEGLSCALGSFYEVKSGYHRLRNRTRVLKIISKKDRLTQRHRSCPERLPTVNNGSRQIRMCAVTSQFFPHLRQVQLRS